MKKIALFIALISAFTLSCKEEESFDYNLFKSKHDTVYITKKDTLYFQKNDTLRIIQKDTLIVLSTDTIRIYKTDTLYKFKTDTVHIIKVDTSFIQRTDTILKKDTLLKKYRILDIGNSFTYNAVEYLPGIVKSLGADVSNISLYRLIRGSASFKNWYDCYNGNDTKIYSYSKILGGLDSKVYGNIDTIDWKYISNDLLLHILNDIKWDKIIIHQSSVYSGEYELWETDENGGYFKQFYEILKKHQPEAEICFLLTHVSRREALKHNETTEERLYKMVDSYRFLKENYGINSIIPVGTAIENLRKTSYNDEYSFSKDNHHLADGIAKYTSACAYYESLLYQYTHKSIIEEFSFNVSLEGMDYTASKPVEINNENRELAKMAAYLGSHIWWKVLNPEDY